MDGLIGGRVDELTDGQMMMLMAYVCAYDDVVRMMVYICRYVCLVYDDDV